MQCCPSCNSELPERAIYCGICGAQAKCKACRDILDPKARFCVNCGTPVGEGNPKPVELSNGSAREPSHNIIEFNEDAKSRRFHAEVSDKAIDSISQPLALFFGTRIVKQVNSGQRQVNNTDTASTENNDDIKIPEGENHPVIDGTKVISVKSDLDVLHQIFRRTSDNKLKLSDPRLKQKDTQRDFVKRLTVLFLYAHELEGMESVPRDDWNALLTDAKVYDSNARSWLNTTDLLDLDENSIRLSLPGRDFARTVIKEYLDPQVEGTWSLESKTRRRTSKVRTEQAEGEGVEGNKNRKSRRAKGESYTAKVRMLFESRFFAEGRTEQEVHAELVRRGFKFELRRVRGAMVALTQSDNLTRSQDESGNWVYKNNQ